MKKLSFFHTPFFFFITYKILTCERRLYLPFTTYKSTTESATLRPSNSGLVCTYNPALAVHFHVGTGL